MEEAISRLTIQISENIASGSRSAITRIAGSGEGLGLNGRTGLSVIILIRVMAGVIVPK